MEPKTTELPIFASDEHADAWLRSTSPVYDQMATVASDGGGYRFRPGDHPLGMLVHENGIKYIELNPKLKGAHRLSILIFEMTNAFQADRHIAIDERAKCGAIDAEIFALRHELIEYDGLRHHRRVLSELENVIECVPPEMLTWINPKLTTLASYSLPFVHDYLDSQNKSGHTAHYRKYFPVQTGQA